jgi:hypothetical protein
MFGNKLYFFSLLAVLVAIVASSSLKSLLTEQAFATTGDGGGTGGGDGGGDGGGGGSGDGGGGGGGHHSHHRHRSHGDSGIINSIPTIPATSTSKPSQAFSFRETLEVSPSLKGIVMTGPTNKFVDSVGTMHIVGELRNDATRTLNVYQIVATMYGLNNQTLGLDNATPTPDTLSPGQSGSFEFFVGTSSDGITDLSQIAKVKYHVGF